jgi:integrase/recombinase XerD
MQFLEQFLEMMLAERGIARNSFIAYKRDMLDFDLYLKNHKITDPLSVTSENIRAFIRYLAEQKIAPRSIARKISAIRSYYHFLISENLTDNNPAHLIDMPKYHNALPNILSIDDIRLLLEYGEADKSPENLRLLAMMHLLYASGLRVSELVSLKLANLSIDAESARINNHINVMGQR